jgi:hypothetical protein
VLVSARHDRGEARLGPPLEITLIEEFLNGILSIPRRVMRQIESFAKLAESRMISYHHIPWMVNCEKPA